MDFIEEGKNETERMDKLAADGIIGLFFIIAVLGMAYIFSS